MLFGTAGAAILMHNRQAQPLHKQTKQLLLWFTLPLGSSRSARHWYTSFSVLPDAKVLAITLTGTRPLESVNIFSRIQLQGPEKRG